DPQAATRIDPGDAAAAGADRLDVIRGEADRMSVDDQVKAFIWQTVDDAGDVAARAPHVHREQIAPALSRPNPAGSEYSTNGPGEHRRDRKTGGRLWLKSSAGVREDGEPGLREACFAEVVLEAPQVAIDGVCDIGGSDRCRCSLIFAIGRQDVA